MRVNLKEVPVFAFAVLLLVVIIPGLFAELIAPHDPFAANLRNRMQPPLFFGGTTEFILGTDRLGRDMLSRIIYGSRYVIVISLIGIVLGAIIGSALGLIAGYYKGFVDALIMRTVDISFALPSVLLALAFATIWQPSFQLVIVVVVLVIWAFFARQVRAEALVISFKDYVARAQLIGSSDVRILSRHILPGVINTIVVLATLQIGVVIMLEATLSFLGIGIPRPAPAWGLLVADGRQLIVTAWWISFFPGVAILLTVMSVNLLGDWLRDRLDPKRVRG